MSYIELYNEQIRDLLNPASGYLELREDSKGRNIQVAGLSEVSTTSTNEVKLFTLHIILQTNFAILFCKLILQIKLVNKIGTSKLNKVNLLFR